MYYIVIIALDCSTIFILGAGTVSPLEKGEASSTGSELPGHYGSQPQDRRGIYIYV